MIAITIMEGPVAGLIITLSIVAGRNDSCLAVQVVQGGSRSGAVCRRLACGERQLRVFPKCRTVVFARKKMHASGSPENHSDGSDDDVVRNEPGFPPIPKDLEYLIEPGIQYGRKYRFDNDVQWFVEKAKESDFETLASLAERVRLSGDYARVLQWWDEVHDSVELMVDERYPYKIDVSEQQRERLLQLISPDLPERQRERCLRQHAEAEDNSDVANARREMRSRLLAEAHNEVHDMDVYFLFGLMDACDFSFEPEQDAP